MVRRHQQSRRTFSCGRNLLTTRNLRLDIAYDGTEFVGWQVQPNGRSVQAVIESAIRKLTGETVRLLTAGRTDSGVHALGQVANFYSATSIPCENLRRGLQRFLPDDVVIHTVTDVPADFHATYSAVAKRYRYLILNRATGDPLLRPYAWQMRQPLDVPAMQAALPALLGKHDFRCFETQFPNKATSVRTIHQARWQTLPTAHIWQRTPAGVSSTGEVQDIRMPTGQPLLQFEIVADGFLYNMVRAIVGTCVAIGRGRWEPDKMAEIIAAQDRGQAGETAPPHGLYLVHVQYGGANDIA